MIAKNDLNGKGEVNGYGLQDSTILKNRLMLKDIRQQEGASIVNLNSSTNLNPVSSDSECSSSVFL